MTQERIDIIVEDKVSSNVSKKFTDIAKSARVAHSAIEELKVSIGGINVSAVDKLSAAQSRLTRATAMQTNAATRQVISQAKQAESSAKVALSQQRQATEAVRTAKAQDQLSQAAGRTAIQQEKLGAASARTAQIQARTAAITAKAAIDQQTAAVRLSAAETRLAASKNVANTAQRVSNQLSQSASRSTRQQAQQTQNLIYQLNDIAVSLASGQRPMTVFLQQGSQIATIFGPGQKGLGGILKELGKALVSFLRPFAPVLLVIGAAAGAVKLLQGEIESTTKKTYTFGQVTAAVWATIKQESKAGLDDLKKNIGLTQENTELLFKFVTGGVKGLLNSIIRAVAVVVSNIGIIIKAALTNIYNFTALVINGVIASLKTVTAGFIDLSRYAQALLPNVEMFQELAAANSKIFNTDYIGDFANAVKGNLKPALEEGAEGLNKAKENAKRLEEALRDLETKIGYETTVQGMDDIEKAALDVRVEVERLEKSYGRLNDKQKEFVESLVKQAQYNAAQENIRDIVEETRTETEKLAEEMARLEKLRPYANTAEDVDALNRKLEQLREGVNPMAEIFRKTAEGITEGFTDAFRNILDGRGGFKSIMRNMVNLLKDSIARMLTIAAARPIIIPVIQAIGSTLGVGAGTIGAVTDQLGGAGSSGSLLSNFSNISSLLSSGGSILPTGAASVVDSFGRSIGIGGFGEIAGPTLPGVYGPAPNGVAMQGGLSGMATIGNIGAGIAGSLLAGGIFGKGMGTSIGSSVGGLGAGLGAAALELGPIGAAALIFGGSLLGGGIGSIFNKKPSSGLQSAALDLSTGGFLERGGLTGKKFNQNNFDAVTGIGSTAAAIAKALGAKGDIQLAVGNRRGSEYALTSDRSVFNADSPLRKSFDSSNEFFRSLTTDLAATVGDGLSETLRTAVKNIDFGKTEDELKRALSDLDFAVAFDTFGQTKEAVSEIKQAWDTLITTFDDAIPVVKRLGLSEDELAKKRATAIDKFRDDFNQSNRNAILSRSAPGYESFLALEKWLKDTLKDAQAIGGDTALIQIRYQQELNALLQENSAAQQEALTAEQDRLDVARDLSQRFSSVVSSFDDILYQMRYGQFTTAAPVQNLDNLRSYVQELGSKAQLNDAAAQEKLAEVLPDFLRLSEEVNGANIKYLADQQLALDLAERTQSAASRQVALQQQIADAAQKQVDLLEKITENFVDTKFVSGNFTGNSFAANNPNKILQRAVAAGAISGDSAMALVRSSGFGGQFGEERASQFFAENPLAASRLFAAMKSIKIEGYADGGIVTGGYAGRDSVPLMAMPEEGVLNRRAMRSIGRDNFHYMNTTGRLPTNDNSGVVAAISGLENRMVALTNVVVAMGDRMVELQGRTAQATEQMVSDDVIRRWK